MLFASIASANMLSDKRLEEAEERLRGPGEDTVRSGAKLCAEINSVESVELLLEVLAGENPHYRDIAWEGLIEIRSPYAQARVASEVAKASRDENLRMWCIQLLGIYGDPAALPGVLDVCGDKHEQVRAAAAAAVGLIKDARAVKPLLKLANDKEPRVRAYAREALGRINAAEHEKILREGLADKDAGARCYLLGCMPQLLPDANAALSLAGLDDADWRVRMQAAENLKTVRTKENLAKLVEKSADVRSIVRSTIRLALEHLTGHGWYDPAQWQRWWTEQQATFDFEEAKKSPKKAAENRSVSVKYHELAVESNHIAFLIDVSSAMREHSGAAQSSKAEASMQELSRVLELLDGKVRFNVFAYDTTARALADKPLDLDGRAAKKALAFIEDASPRGPKDIWAALLAATENPDLDTIYLLASGEPEVGLYVHYNRIALYLRERQRFGKFVVHGVVYTDSDWYAKQIEEICRATGGEFRWVK